MNQASTSAEPGFAQGQLWKTDTAYLQIVDLGKRSIYYKLLKDPRQPAAITRLIRTDALAVYLRATEAHLVN